MSFINCNLAYHVNNQNGFVTPLKEGSSVKVLTCTNKNGSSSSFGEKTMEKKSLQNLSSAILCNDIIACFDQNCQKSGNFFGDFYTFWLLKLT